MKDQIDRMDVHEHFQILEIIQKYTTNFTKTESGVLVSTDMLNDECLEEIQKYILFCLDQRKRIEEDTKERKIYERIVNSE